MVGVAVVVFLVVVGAPVVVVGAAFVIGRRLSAGIPLSVFRWRFGEVVVV